METDYVDLHCHILPGIDDGAKNVQESRGVLEDAVRKGVTRFVFTPHFYKERISVEKFVEQRSQAVNQLLPIAEELGIKFRIGAEIQYTPILASLPLDKLSFSDTRYLLLELLPFYEPHDVIGLIKRIRKAGYVPILAHIERFSYIMENPPLLYKWVKAGALAQINSGWLQKEKHARKSVQQLFNWNLVHVMASDTHSVDTRPENLTEGYELLPKEIAEVFQKNAEMIFLGKDIEVKEPALPIKRFGRWR